MAFWLPLLMAGAGLASGAMSAKTQAKAATQSADAQAQAAVRAAEIQAGSAREGLDLERSIYGDQRQLYAPQARLGAGALARQAVMAGISPDEARSYYNGVDQAYSDPGPGMGRNSFTGIYDGYSADLTDEQRRASSAFLASRPDIQQEWEARGDGGARAGEQQLFENDPVQFAAWFLSREPQGGAPATTQQASTGADPLAGYTAQSWQTTDPGYAFRMSEGAKALERSAIAGGGAFSGAYDKALSRYTQDYASNEYQNAFNRLGTIAGAGQSATGALSGAATNYGQNAGQYITNAGNAQAQGVTNAGNARASGYQAGGQAWGNFWGDTVPGAVGVGAGAFAGKKGWF